MAVKDSDIERRTSFTLGLEKNQFTISDREDNGVQTDYVVKTNAGETYRCYVTGVVSITGSTVSDAICSKGGGKVSASKAAGGSNCNALLEAARKC